MKESRTEASASHVGSQSVGWAEASQCCIIS